MPELKISENECVKTSQKKPFKACVGGNTLMCFFRSDNRGNRLRKVMRHVYTDHLFGVVRRHVLDKVTDLCNRENGQNKLDSQTKCWEVGCERRQQKSLTDLAEHYSLYHKVSTHRQGRRIYYQNSQLSLIN